MDADPSAAPENFGAPPPAAADVSSVEGNGNTPYPNGNNDAANGIAPHPAPVEHADGPQETGTRAPEPAPSRGLGAHSATAYASAPEAERYRRIMRVFYLNKTRDLNWRLNPEQVAAKVRDAFGLELDTATMQRALDQLTEWDALICENDSSDAATAREFRRKRFTYDITPAAEKFDRLLLELDNLVDEVGALEASRLPGIRDAIAKIATGLATPSPSGGDLRDELEYLVNSIGSLREGAAQFMSRVGALVSSAEAINEQDFQAYKSSLIEHLEGFHRALRVHSEEIIAQLRRVTPAQEDLLAELVAGVDAAPALPGADPAETHARRREEIRGRWHAVQSWFIGDTHQHQTWSHLTNKVLEAIQAVLDIAERIIDRAANRADRASAWEYLAALCHASTEQHAIEWFAVAVGAKYPRHFNTPETEAPQRPAQTTWVQADPAPVAAHLRRPGSRSPGAGRGAPLRDNSAAARIARERRVLEREQIKALTDRFAGRGPIALSDIGALSSVEFGHVIDWICRAYESTPDKDGSRSASSLDLSLLVLLRPPIDPAERAVLDTTYGKLHAPNYTLEVIEA